MMKKIYEILVIYLLLTNISFAEEKSFKNIVNIKFCDDERYVKIDKDCPNKNEISNLEAVVISLEKEYNRLFNNGNIISDEQFNFLSTDYNHFNICFDKKRNHFYSILRTEIPACNGENTIESPWNKLTLRYDGYNYFFLDNEPSNNQTYNKSNKILVSEEEFMEFKKRQKKVLDLIVKQKTKDEEIKKLIENYKKDEIQLYKIEFEGINRVEIDFKRMIFYEKIIYPSGRMLWDRYKIKEIDKEKAIIEVSYETFALDLGESAYGGNKKFLKKNKKKILESKKNCSCENPIYIRKELDFKNNSINILYHPDSDKPTTNDDFRMKAEKLKFAGMKIKKVFDDHPELILVVAAVVDLKFGISTKSSGGSSVSNITQNSSSNEFVGSGIKIGDVPIESIMSACRRGMLSACF